jgi:TDG/mug DNA glycosylase family protein
MIDDILAPGLTVVFVGTAKSTTSAAAGHYYANPRNRFWDLLYETGLTQYERLTPDRDRTLLRYGVGLTDLVSKRAASSDALLRSSDFDVRSFVRKVEQFDPRIVAFNGGRAATVVARYLNRVPPAEGPIGWPIGKTLAFRLPSSSSANARGGYQAKRTQWIDFGDWVRSTVVGNSDEAVPR